MEKNKNLLKTIKELFSSNDKSGKIQFLVLLILIGVLLVIFADSLSSSTSPVKETFANESSDKSKESTFKIGDLTELESILGEIKGVGKVKVMVTYENSGKSIYATDVNQTVDTEEQKSGDGKTVTKKNEDMKTVVVFNGQKAPIMEDKMAAKVKGVLVVAEGADDPLVCTQILHAVRVLTGVEVHEIAICPYK